MTRTLLPFILAAFVGQNQQPPSPPYARESTVVVYDTAYEPAVCVEGAVFYTASGARCSAFALPSLRRKWNLNLPAGESAGGLAVAEGTVLLTTDPAPRGRESHLYAIEAATGRIQWSLPRTCGASRVAVSQGVAYTGLKPFSISAVDVRSRTRRWTHSFPAARNPDMPPGGRIEAVTCFGSYLLVNCENITYCLDASNGRERWRQEKSYVLWSGLPVSDGIAAVPAGEGMVGREIRTGKVLWKDSHFGLSDGARVLLHHFVGIDGGSLRAIEPRSGKARWSKRLGPADTSGGNQYVSAFGDLIFARGVDRAGVFKTNGQALSTGSAEEALPQPYWSNGTFLVCFDGTRLLAYRTGRVSALPRVSEMRRRLAAELVRGFDSLDKAEVSRLKSLGDDAFEPVLAAFLATCAAHDAAAEKHDTYPLYRKYHDLGEVLARITTAKRTDALLKALRRVKKSSSSRPILLDLAAKVGDSAVVTPYFLDELKVTRTPGFELYESTSYVARNYIARSKDPRAVAFLIHQLKDPKGDQTLRLAAYWHLAGSGDPEAVKAVLAERSRRATLRPLEQRVLSGVLNAGEFGTKTKVLAEQSDGKEHTWGLLQSGVLGSAGDLWLAEKVEGTWTHPFFTGVSTSPVSAWAKPAPPEPRIGGRTGKELAAGAWLEVLAGNPDIRRDADGDGLTDLVEKRLGTDPNLRDTDGDGDPDEVDPWPNAPPRALSDDEKIYAAVFEARFHFDASEGPALMYMPPTRKPFEMPGRQGATIWLAEKEGRGGWSHPLEHRYEQGVAFINFEPPRSEKRAIEVIRWNKDRTEATLGISVYFGGLNGTGYAARVRKFGDEWLVVAMDMAYVS